MAAATQQKQAASIIKMVQWQDHSLARWCWQQMLPRSKRQQQDVFIANQCDNQVLPAATTKVARIIVGGSIVAQWCCEN